VVSPRFKEYCKFQPLRALCFSLLCYQLNRLLSPLFTLRLEVSSARPGLRRIVYGTQRLLACISLLPLFPCHISPLSLRGCSSRRCFPWLAIACPLWPPSCCRSRRVLHRCSRSILRRTARRRRRRRRRARVAHLPVFRGSRCSRCRWCPERAESEASAEVFPVVPVFHLKLGRGAPVARSWRLQSLCRRLRSHRRIFRLGVILPSF